MDMEKYNTYRIGDFLIKTPNWEDYIGGDEMKDYFQNVLNGVLRVRYIFERCGWSFIDF